MGKIIIDTNDGHAKYYDNEENLLPSVTTILSMIGGNNDSLIFWANKLGLQRKLVKDEQNDAMKTGTLTHEFIHYHLLNKSIDLINTNEYTFGQIRLAKKLFNLFIEWFNNLENFELIYTEKSFVCDQLGYGGTVDLVAKINNKITLLDFKTSSNFYKKYFIQLAAYNRMLQGKGIKNIEEVGILRFDKSKILLEELFLPINELKPYYNSFRKALELYKTEKAIDEIWKLHRKLINKECL